LVNPAAIEIPPVTFWVAALPATRQEERFRGKLRTRLPGTISGPDPGDP
jgi:hypothetical protein